MAAHPDSPAAMPAWNSPVAVPPAMAEPSEWSDEGKQCWDFLNELSALFDKIKDCKYRTPGSKQQDVELLVTKFENIDVRGTENERDYINFLIDALLGPAKKLLVECTTAALDGSDYAVPVSQPKDVVELVTQIENVVVRDSINSLKKNNLLVP